jgi:hypothetical protein
MRVASEINILRSYDGDPTFDLAAHRGGFGMKLHPATKDNDSIEVFSTSHKNLSDYIEIEKNGGHNKTVRSC